MTTAFRRARLATALVSLFCATAAYADTVPQTLPFSQDWSDASLITTSDDWSGVDGITGYRGDNLTATTGADPQTLTGEDTGAVVDVNANQTNPVTFVTGGVAEFDLTDDTIALTGSGTADAPYITIFLDTTGASDITVEYDVRDLDSSTDDAIQQVALQYRVGSSGSFTNLSGGYVADATTASAATQVTSVSVALPAAAEDESHVELRIMTTNASGNDEWVGIDNISIEAAGTATDPTDPTGVGTATPSAVLPNESVTLEVEVTPGTNPDSTNLSVEFDLSPIGGSSSVVAFDNGAGDDATAGDGIFTVAWVVDGATSPGPVSVPVSIGDGEGRSSATTVDFTVVDLATIPEIQGDGTGSPLAIGTDVVTEGIVTALRSNGYFIQSYDDGDAATPQGLFVYTSTAPPAEAVPGNLVRVSGEVAEFSRTVHGLPLTQLTNTGVTVLATGQALPAWRELRAIHLQPGIDPTTLGRYQGMRVKFSRAVVVGPSNDFGDFYITLPKITRPAREEGIAVFDAVPLPGGNAIPLFDKNAERLRVESTGLTGGTEWAVDAGTRIDNLEGILYYDRGDFTLLLGDHTGFPATAGKAPVAVPTADTGVFRIGSFNIENLSGGASVDADRLDKLSEVFCDYMKLPDIVGLVEIGDLATAERVAEAINTNEFGHCEESPMYEAHLLASSGSQRLGFLISTKPAPGDGSKERVEILDIEELFVGEMLKNPNGVDDGVLFDRPPLYLQARVNGDNGATYDVDVILNHTLSLLDVNSLDARAVWGTDGDRSRGKRAAQAFRVSQKVDEIQDTDPTQALVLIGDYNAFDFNDGYVDVMGIISGSPAVTNEVLLHSPSAVSAPLTNLIVTKPVAEQYSYVHEGNVQVLDHALANDAILATTDATLYHARVNSDYATAHETDPSVVVRTSDHDPLVADFVVPDFLDADIAASIVPRSLKLRTGNSLVVDAYLTNNGPLRALDPTLNIHIDVPPAQIVSAKAPGWICAGPVAAPGGTAISCVRSESLAPAATDKVVVVLVAPLQPTITLDASGQTGSIDTDASNDAAPTATVTVLPPRT